LAQNWLGIVVLVLALLPGQAVAQKITVEFDQAADFTKYKTFTFLNGQLRSNNPALNSELVKKQIEADIVKDLATKGLTKVDGPSDLNVVYQFGSQRDSEVEAYPAGWRGMGTRVVHVPSNEGTLVVNLRDRSTHSLVWRGIASVEESDANKIEGKLDDMVQKIVAKYPPKPK
jgi:hypothetical protein